ncbi:hypothetical protein [Jannaschia seosinensis]|uniref:hypothetical protein n=1 Tax=Jannaschia seosinensis TaxID=313367 RepID=UPI0011874B0C|nr:hypothetical protein [Jannaschia seosinensis]
MSFAMALCEGEVQRVGRIWADGEEIDRNSIQIHLHTGAEDQLPDGLMEAVEGAGTVPAYRGTAYVVIEDLNLTPYGNRIPNLSFEVVRYIRIPGETAVPAELIEGVALIPGTGEYALATTAVHYDQGIGRKESANINTKQSASDFRVALREMIEELPNLKSVTLVVSWFGDDLRCGSCSIRPAVEQKDCDGKPLVWSVSGLDRQAAMLVPTLDGRPVYGGTPCDHSVVEAIRELKSRGIKVTFYPFILMIQTEGNGLPDPYGGPEQACLPWRGRITSSIPARQGRAPRSTNVHDEVKCFFGQTRQEDIVCSSGTKYVSLSGPPNDWSYRRFVLHYAALCREAGEICPKVGDGPHQAAV